MFSNLKAQIAFVHQRHRYAFVDTRQKSDLSTENQSLQENKNKKKIREAQVQNLELLKEYKALVNMAKRRKI